ncbi:MAG: hypothetical protein P4M05_22660 [Bradyrhizobium sp.]|nr:hypothetical protein [Bradyrhizobium sp.]
MAESDLSVGTLSGFFGIGGGFLIEPGLLCWTDMRGRVDGFNQHLPARKTDDG